VFANLPQYRHPPVCTTTCFYIIAIKGCQRLLKVLLGDAPISHDGMRSTYMRNRPEVRTKHKGAHVSSLAKGRAWKRSWRYLYYYWILG
jgi:hypothetical protein